MQMSGPGGVFAVPDEHLPVLIALVLIGRNVIVASSTATPPDTHCRSPVSRGGRPTGHIGQERLHDGHEDAGHVVSRIECGSQGATLRADDFRQREPSAGPTRCPRR